MHFEFQADIPCSLGMQGKSSSDPKTQGPTSFLGAKGHLATLYGQGQLAGSVVLGMTAEEAGFSLDKLCSSLGALSRPWD